MMNKDFDYQGLINKMEEHIKNPKFKGLLERYTCKATCVHPDNNSKVILTMHIENDKIIDCGFLCEGFSEDKFVSALIGQSSLYLDSAINAILSETMILAGNLLKQIKDDTSTESRNSMMFLVAYKDCVEAYYEKEKKERISKLIV